MNTVPTVPDDLDKDFTSWHDLVLRWKDVDDRARESYVWRDEDRSFARIELRPVVVVEGLDREGGGTEILAEIPLGSLVSIDVDDPDRRLGAVDENGYPEEIEVSVPVAPWVRDPDKGLLRFTA